jgi:hypothetical protein
MTRRDRLVIIGFAAAAVLGAVWFLLVAPERQQAASLQKQVIAAASQLQNAESSAQSAQGAQARYSAAYASIVSLGKAVPANEQVPSLMYQLAQASNQKNVDFSSIVAGGGSASSPSKGAAASPGAATAAATTAGFTQMPFTFIFTGTFSNLYDMFSQLNNSTVRTASGGLRVSGRLLTVQEVKLAPEAGEQKPGNAKSAKLTGTITATAYVLPAGQGLTAGATASSPSSASTSPTSTASAPAAAATSSSAPPAVVGATR